jgi:hypothetical protein
MAQGIEGGSGRLPLRGIVLLISIPEGRWAPDDTDGEAVIKFT